MSDRSSAEYRFIFTNVRGQPLNPASSLQLQEVRLFGVEPSGSIAGGARIPLQRPSRADPFAPESLPLDVARAENPG
eukprot:4329285-Prymnesium_polylepis.1